MGYDITEKDFEQKFLSNLLFRIQSKLIKNTFPICSAIKFHEGLLLFSKTKEGETALNNYLYHLSCQPQDTDIENPTLQVMKLPILFPEMKEYIDKANKYCYPTTPLSGITERLPDTVFAPDAISKFGICTEKYSAYSKMIRGKIYYLYHNAGTLSTPPVTGEISVLKNLFLRPEFMNNTSQKEYKKQYEKIILAWNSCQNENEQRIILNKAREIAANIIYSFGLPYMSEYYKEYKPLKDKEETLREISEKKTHTKYSKRR